MESKEPWLMLSGSGPPGVFSSSGRSTFSPAVLRCLTYPHAIQLPSLLSLFCCDIA